MAVLRFSALLLLIALPAGAQITSNVSAGGAPTGQSPAIVTRPAFNHGHRGNRFGSVIFSPFGYYDGYYDRYPAPAEPRPVVVILEEKPAAPVPPPAPAADPKIVEVPQAMFSSTATPRNLTTVFVLTDGRRLESQNFTITSSTLVVREPRRPLLQVPLEQLNVEATLSENHRRGIDLQLPESRSEILISF